MSLLFSNCDLSYVGHAKGPSEAKVPLWYIIKSKSTGDLFIL